MNKSTTQAIADACEAIESSEALLICAGAGMGVDSGLPDFRGNEGFWKAYPAFKGRHFSEMSNPRWFARDPELAWGFFGHRYNLYSAVVPHDGFRVLRKIAQRMSFPPAIFTSNVDGQFQKAGFDCKIVECHGAIHHMQCSTTCTDEIWPAENLELEVNEDIRLVSKLPRCPNCGNVARPNIMMFGDYAWISKRTDSQERKYHFWNLEVQDSPLVIIEMGAGQAIPTVRLESERHNAKLIRINPRDSDGPEGTISIPLGALDALHQIEEQLV